MNDNVQKALNEQIHTEFESAYIYLAMAAHFEAESLVGFAGWMRKQSQEEIGHGMRLFDHLLARGGRVQLKALAGQPATFGSPLSVFETALEHEREVTASIYRLFEIAVKESDLPTQVELHWFITEQVEEENSVLLIVDKLRRIGDNDAALLFIDRELGQRGSE